jgi:hypothetical protein
MSQEEALISPNLRLAPTGTSQQRRASRERLGLRMQSSHRMVHCFSFLESSPQKIVTTVDSFSVFQFIQRHVRSA